MAKKIEDIDAYVEKKGTVSVNKELTKLQGEGIRQRLISQNYGDGEKPTHVPTSKDFVKDLAVTTLTTLIESDPNYKASLVQLKMIAANKQYYSEADYQEKLKQLQEVVLYRKQLIDYHKSEKKTRERIDSLRNNPEIREIKKEIDSLKSEKAKVTPGKICGLVKDYRERLENIGVLSTNIEEVIDFDEFCKNGGMTDKDKKFLSELITYAEEINKKIQDGMSVTELPFGAKDEIHIKTKYMNLLIYIASIIGRRPDEVHFMDIKSKRSNKGVCIREELIKFIDDFKEKDLKDRIDDLTLEMKNKKSQIINDKVPAFIRDAFGLETQEGIRKSKELLAASQMRYVYALAAVICKSRGLSQSDVPDVAGEGLLKLAEALDKYIGIIKRPGYENMSLSVWITDEIYYPMVTFANSLRNIISRNPNAEVYEYNKTNRDFKKFVADMQIGELSKEQQANLFMKFVTGAEGAGPNSIAALASVRAGTKVMSVDALAADSDDDIDYASNIFRDDEELADEKLHQKNMIEITLKDLDMFFEKIVYLKQLRRAVGFETTHEMRMMNKTYFNENEIDLLKKKFGYIQNPNSEDGQWHNNMEIASTIFNSKTGKMGVAAGTFSYMLGDDKPSSIPNKLRRIIEDYGDWRATHKSQHNEIVGYIRVCETVLNIIINTIKKKGINSQFIAKLKQ